MALPIKRPNELRISENTVTINGNLSFFYSIRALQILFYSALHRSFSKPWASPRTVRFRSTCGIQNIVDSTHNRPCVAHFLPFQEVDTETRSKVFSTDVLFGYFRKSLGRYPYGSPLKGFDSQGKLISWTEDFPRQKTFLHQLFANFLARGNLSLWCVAHICAVPYCWSLLSIVSWSR